MNILNVPPADLSLDDFLTRDEMRQCFQHSASVRVEDPDTLRVSLDLRTYPPYSFEVPASGPFTDEVAECAERCSSAFERAAMPSAYETEIAGALAALADGLQHTT